MPSITNAVSAEFPPWEKDEYVAIRELARVFCKNEIEPKILDMEEQGFVPRELLKKMADLGFFGVAIPEEYGGTNLGLVGLCVLADEMAFSHVSSAVAMGAHAELACNVLSHHGTEDQKRRYLIPGVAGEKIGAFATTEPNVGSNVGGIKTRAEKVSGGWKLYGSKQFITNGEIADFVIVFAQTDPTGGNKTLACYIVDKVSDGFAVTKREKKIGLHASCTNSLALDGVFVPDENLVGRSGDGFKIAMSIFNLSRITLAASCVGIMRRAEEEAVNFVKERVVFDEPLWVKQNTQMELAQITMMRELVENYVFMATWRADRGKDVRREAAVAKYFASELAGVVVDRALQLHGGSGYIEDNVIARLYRDVRVFRLFEGTSEVQKLVVFKDALLKNFM